MLPLAFEVLGWFGTAFAIAMFLPQVVKVVRTRDVEGLSKASFGVYAFGSSMWVVFCGLTNVWQGVACNGTILILICIIFFYIFAKRKWIFFLMLVYAAAIFIVSVILAFVVKDPGIALNYVFVLLAGGALAISFIPQVRTIFIIKDFQSYSVLTSVLLIICNVFWGSYWAGKVAFPPDGGPSGTLPVFIIALVTTVAQIIVQLAALPVYFKSTGKGPHRQERRGLRS